MRFAGSAPITDFLSQSMDHGAVAQKAAETRSAVNQAGIDLQGQTAASGISAAGEVESAGIMADAQAGLAQAQGNAAMFKTIGQIGGAAVGAFGGAGGGGGGGAAAAPMSSGLNYSPSGWNNMSKAVGTPNYNTTPPISFLN